MRISEACPTELELAASLDALDPTLSAHLDTCEPCRTSRDAFERSVELARQLPFDPPSSLERDRMRASVLARSSELASPLRTRGLFAPVRETVVLPDRTQPAAIVPPRDRGRGMVLAALGALVAAAAVALFVATPDRVAPHRHGHVQPMPGARYTVTHAPDEVIRLEHGELEVEVAPLHRGERFRVVIGDAEIEVRGTAFIVRAADDRLIDVAVTHGLVEVRAAGRTTRALRRGESWRPAPSLRPRSSASTISSLSSASPASPAPAPSASPASSAPASPAPPAPSAPSAGTAPLPPSTASASLASAGSRPSSPRPAGSSRTPTPSAAVTSLPSAARDSAKRPASAGSSAPARSRATDTSRPAASGDGSRPTAAAKARSPDELAYDAGWSALRARDFASAQAAFARVFLLAPDGVLAEDASFWRAVALARGARAAEAANAFRDFLSAHPRAARTGEANAMLGWLLVDLRQHSEAARHFRAASTDANPSVRASAREGIAATAKD